MKIFLALIWTVIIAIDCQICNEGCFQCDPSTKMCKACANGYQLTIVGACVKDSIRSCNLYLSEGNCMRCSATNKLIGNSCTKDYSGCLQNLTRTVCTQCFQGLTLMNDQCLGVLNCAKYNKTCQKCDSGFTLSNGICLDKSLSCVQYDFASGVCIECAINYTLIGYKCILNLFANPNCQLYNQKGFCLICKTGYTQVYGNCYGINQATTLGLSSSNSSNSKKSISKEANSNNISQETNIKQNSAEGVVPIISNKTQNILPISQNKSQIKKSGVSNNTSDANGNAWMILNCKKIVNKICQECYPGYFLNSSSCNRIDPTCKLFNSTSLKCIECYQGYALSYNNKCSLALKIDIDPNCKQYNSNQDCTLCFANYYILDGVCTPVNPLCRQSSSNGSCLSCYNGYVLSQFNCIVNPSDIPNLYDPYCIEIADYICKVCTNGYYVNQNYTCVPLSLNCQTHNMTNGKCLTCIQGYVLVDSQCFAQIDNCRQYNASGRCIECPNGYFIKLGICYKNDVTCANYNQNGVCIKCVETYYLINQACIYPSLGFDAFCTKYVNSYCVQCKTGSFLSNYRCQVIDPNCISFNYQTFRCQKCKQNMRPVAIRCI